MDNSVNQQQQQHQVTTILVPQPVVVRRGVPFMRRGAEVCGGYRCGACSISFLTVFGGVFIFLGFQLAASVSYIGILILMIGVVLSVVGYSLCCLASKQFNALPADHPERLKYSSGVAVPARGRHAYTTYDVPVGAQVVNYPFIATQGTTVLPAGQMVSYPGVVPGQQYYHGVPQAQMVDHYTGPLHPGQIVANPPSAMATRPYSDDTPPSYEEITKNRSNI